MMEVRRVINIHRGEEYIRLEIVSNSSEGHSTQPLPTITEENMSYLDDYIESPIWLPFLRILTESSGIQELADRLRELNIQETEVNVPNKYLENACMSSWRYIFYIHCFPVNYHI